MKKHPDTRSTFERVFAMLPPERAAAERAKLEQQLASLPVSAPVADAPAPEPPPAPPPDPAVPVLPARPPAALRRR